MMGIESPVYQSAPLFCKSRASSSIGSLHISNSQSHGHGSISKQQKLYYSKIVSKCSFSVEIPRINCKPLLASAFVCRSSLASLKDDQEDSQRKVPDVQSLLRRFWKVAEPYWFSDHKVEARWRLAAVFALTLGTTGISVGFNLLGRDFFNAIANKDQEQFTKLLLYYLASFAGGIPVFVLRDYAKDTLSLRWRSWMTGFYMDRYLNNRAFYKIQSQSIIDNPDQRIVDDLSSFTGTALAFSLTLFNATVDLISFSYILYGIYPPLFLVLVGYSLGGTAISVYLGRGLVNLNFLQEKKEADFRYGLVRVRENAESIAFYDGEENEMQLLLQRFRSAFDNLNKLLISSRNLGFFTSGYRYLIQILPAAVVAPMYFSGKIELGVINQSASAFNHILRDFSLIVYQFQAISAFSAVIDRLGEFDELLTSNETDTDSAPMEEIYREFCCTNTSDMYNGVEPLKGGSKLLSIEHLTLLTPSKETLIRDLWLEICENDHLLITGPSGTGKTSLLRALAGLWSYGRGAVRFYNKTTSDASPCLSSDVASPKATSFYQNKNNSRDVVFLPQKPYMVLGSLRQQLLYPTRSNGGIPVLDTEASNGSLPFLTRPRKKDSGPMKPTTDDLVQILEDVRLGSILSRFDLDSTYEWSSVLSVGEQQRLAFARLLLMTPNLVLLDESTSALDETLEALMYQLIGAAGITYVSIGHRRTLYEHHKNVLHISQLDPTSELPNWLLQPITCNSSKQ